MSRKALVRFSLYALGGWVAIATILLVLGYFEAKRGRDALEAIRSSAQSSGFGVDKVDGELDHAVTQLGRAHGHLNSPVLWPVRAVPYVGHQIDSAVALTGAAHEVAEAANDIVSQSEAISELSKTDRVGTLKLLKDLVVDTDKRLDDVTLGPEKGLVGPLANAREQIKKQLNRADEDIERAIAGVSAATELLGNDHRYLVVAANNAEMRAGSGMFLSVGVMTTTNGNIELGDMETVGKVIAPSGSITWPKDLEDRWGWLGYQNDFRNLMVSPRLDAAAQIAADIWKKTDKGDVDGVLMVDPVALKALLKATGSVRVNDKEITADNVLKEVFFDQYKVINGTSEAQEARRENLSVVAKETFTKLNSGSWDPVVLARELSKAAAGRHMLIWSKDNQMNDWWDSAGLSGRMKSNSMMLSLVNVGGNKLDQFLQVDATLNKESNDHWSVVVKVKNNSPLEGPYYVLGPSPVTKLKKSEYQGMLSFSLPKGSTSPSFDQDLPLTVNGVDGDNVAAATLIRVEAGAEKSFTFKFVNSDDVPAVLIEPSARVPATTWHFGKDTWKDEQSQEIQASSLQAD